MTAIWLLPFYPSPLRDDGYDISDYKNVHPSYGTLQRFQGIPARGPSPRAAGDHRTGAQPHFRPARWFQRARRARPGSPARDFYVWSDTPGKIQGSADHFQGFRVLELVLGPGGQRLLLASLLLAPAGPELRQSRGAQRPCIEVLDFWLDMGVDGLRLDAVPYLYEREGTNCENLPETHS